jgi:hypothetical protein
VTNQGYGQGQPYGAAPGQGSPAPATGTSAKGFVASLFDTSFTSFVTPTIIKVVYVLVMVLAGLGALGIAFSGFSINVGVGIITLIIFAPLAFFVELALWRISLEIFMVIFRMSDDVRAIRNGGGFR